MTTEVSYPHIEKMAGQPARFVRIPRLSVAHIVAAYLAHGWSAEELVRQYPNLTISESHAAMLYYFDHQEELDREVIQGFQQYESVREAAQSSPFAIRMRAKGLL